ncbi:MAG: hypothetical protein ABEK17_00980 [Candidatus Aenigmatarchaeota archaeon]
MKGQVLVLIAIVVSIVIILIGVEADYVSSLHTREIKEGKDVVNTLENLKEEYMRIVSISLSNDKSLKNLNEDIMDFSAFVDRNLASKQSLLFYSASEVEDGFLKIFVGNFKDEDIIDVTVDQNLTDEEIEIDEVGRGGSEMVKFNISSAMPSNYSVNISYLGSSSNKFYQEIYMCRADDTNRFNVYYDLKVSLEDSYVSERFQINEGLNG